MILKESRNSRRQHRHRRVRKKVRGDSARPRLVVFRSSGHIYAQIVDDSESRTLLTVSSLDKTLEGVRGGNVEGAEKVGALLAERAKERGIAQVVFDRGGYRYHGRVAALAEAARNGGLEF